jgi:hypothetical protein
MDTNASSVGVPVESVVTRVHPTTVRSGPVPTEGLSFRLEVGALFVQARIAMSARHDIVVRMRASLK